MDEIDNIEKETHIEDSSLSDAETQSDADSVEIETPEDTDESVDESAEITPIFSREDWSDRVNDFEESYPLARELGREIGEVLLEDEHLWNDEGCLEKAMLRVLCSRYTPDGEKARDEAFLNDYIYNNEDIRSKIVGDYMDELNRSQLPQSMTRGGRISLSSPARPRTLREAGAIAEKIMRR